MAYADADLERLVAAAPQLQHVERLDLGEVEVGIYAFSGTRYLKDCITSCDCVRCFDPISYVEQPSRMLDLTALIVTPVTTAAIFFLIVYSWVVWGRLYTALPAIPTYLTTPACSSC